MKAQFPDEQTKSGEFQRQPDAFREWLSNDGSTAYPAAADRYHLYVSLACPWASRTVIFRKLKGLDEAIGMTIVDPIRDEEGWAFRDPSGKIPPGAPFESTDPINGFQFLARSVQGNRSRLQRARHCAGALGQTNKEDREQLRGRYLPHVQRSVQ